MTKNAALSVAFTQQRSERYAISVGVATPITDRTAGRTQRATPAVDLFYEQMNY